MVDNMADRVSGQNDLTKMLAALRPEPPREFNLMGQNLVGGPVQMTYTTSNSGGLSQSYSAASLR